jgi:hypothetical protein
MRLEEIHILSISHDFVEEQPSAGRVVDATLEQRNHLRFCNYAFELFNHCFLSVKFDGKYRHPTAYELNIGILDPEPKQLVRIGWRYLTAFLILAATATLTACADIFRTSSMLPTLLAAGAGLSLVLTVYGCYNRLVFYTLNGRVPLVVMLNSNPQDETFRAFTETLTRHILEIRDRSTSRREMLCEELKEHRRLYEEGVISDKCYHKVKQYILGLHHLDP